MDLRQLEYVVAVVDAGGFTAGAAVVHVAQPSLSARIRDLERELGVDLFHRVGRGVRLSSAGAVVVDHARLVLRDVQTLKAAAAGVLGLQGGTLDLVALPTLAIDPLSELIGRLRAAHPGLHVTVAEADDVDRGGARGGIAGAVRSGRAEVGLAELSGAIPDLVEIALADQELVAIGGPADVRGLRELAAFPLVLTPPGTSSRRVVDEAFAALGIEPVIAVEVAQREAVVPLVLAGAGVAFVPGAQAAAARAQGAVAREPVPALVRRIGLIHRADRLSPGAQAFVEMATRGPRSPKGLGGVTRNDR